MVDEAEQTLETMHFALHAVRQLSKYKPTQFETKISWLISDYFQDRCRDCKEVINTKREEAERKMRGEGPMQNQNIFDKILGR